MREKPAKEASVEKTLAFLKDLKLQCEGLGNYSIAALHSIYHISNYTGTACKKLGIIKASKDGYEWLKGEPDRAMALLILDYMLDRAKKDVNLPLKADWTQLEAIGNIIIDRLNTIAKTGEVSLNRLKTPQKANGEELFKEQEQKQRDRIEIISHLCATLFLGWGQLDPLQHDDSPDKEGKTMKTISRINRLAIIITDDLLEQLNIK